MMVTGQPKNTAEYIQATSRVGRDPTRPGLVLTVFQWSRPRDLAHYESFAYDHTTFGMLGRRPLPPPRSVTGLSTAASAAVAHRRRPALRIAALPNTAARTRTVPL